MPCKHKQNRAAKPTQQACGSYSSLLQVCQTVSGHFDGLCPKDCVAPAAAILWLTAVSQGYLLDQLQNLSMIHSHIRTCK